MSKNLFKKFISNINYFEDFERAFNDCINAGVDSFHEKLEESILAYLIACEHVSFFQQLSEANYFFAANYFKSNAEIKKIALQLNVCIDEYRYKQASLLVEKLNKEITNSVLDKDQDQEIKLFRKVLYTKNDEIQMSSNICKHLKSEEYYESFIKDLELKITAGLKLISIYQSNIELLDLINKFIVSLDSGYVSEEDQKKYLSIVDEMFISELSESVYPINQNQTFLEFNLAEIRFHPVGQLLEGFSLNNKLQIIDKLNLTLFSIEELKDLEDKALNMEECQHINLAIKAAALHKEYQEICMNLIEIQQLASFKKLLFKLAELKSKSTKTKQHKFWQVIVLKFENNLVIDQRLEIDPSSFDKSLKEYRRLLKQKLQVESLKTYYDLACKSFNQSEKNQHNNNLYWAKSNWLSTCNTKEQYSYLNNTTANIIRLNDNQDKEYSEFYLKFIYIYSNISMFNNSSFKCFENINLSEYVENITAIETTSKANKKLAYKTIYQRLLRQDPSKFYQDAYSGFIELCVIYLEAFIEFDLDSIVHDIEDVFCQIRKKYLMSDQDELCSKLLTNLEILYRESVKVKLWQKASDMMKVDNELIEDLKSNFSDSDGVIPQAVFSVKSKLNEFLAIDSNTHYIEELNNVCEKANPLLGGDQKLSKIISMLNGIQTKLDKRVSVPKLLELIDKL